MRRMSAPAILIAIALLSLPACDPGGGSGAARPGPEVTTGRPKQSRGPVVDVEAALEEARSDERSVRATSVQKLQLCDDPRATLALLKLTRDADEHVRSMASGSLHKDDEEFRSQVIAALDSEDADIQAAAAEYCGNRKCSEALDKLVAFLEHPGEDVRLQAVKALGLIGDSKATGPVIGRLNDSSEQIRVAAVRAIGELRDPRAVQVLSVAVGDEDKNVAREAVISLGKIGGGAVIDEFVYLLDKTDDSIQTFIARELAEICDERALDVLLRSLDDSDIDGHAITGLVRIGEPAVEKLIALLPEGRARDFVRANAAEALGKIGDLRAVEPLIAVIGDKDTLLRDKTIEALSRLGDVRAVEPLVRVLKTCRPRTEESIKKALVDLSPHSIDPLLRELNSSEEETRNRAGRALAQIEHPRVESYLLEAARSRNLRVVATTYVFYLKRKDRDSKEALIAALEQYGTKAMAEAMLNGGDSDMQKAAREWATKHGYTIMPMFRD